MNFVPMGIRLLEYWNGRALRTRLAGLKMVGTSVGSGEMSCRLRRPA